MTHTQIAVWLSALKSGAYTQCQRMLTLRASPEAQLCHCCLGVLSAEFGIENRGQLLYPWLAEIWDSHLVTDFASLEQHGPFLMMLNDSGPIDAYQRVIADIEGALECYITH